MLQLGETEHRRLKHYCSDYTQSYGHLDLGDLSALPQSQKLYSVLKQFPYFHFRLWPTCTKGGSTAVGDIDLVHAGSRTGPTLNIKSMKLRQMGKDIRTLFQNLL